MKKLAVFLMMVSLETCGGADGWQQCCTDQWLRYVGVPGQDGAPAQDMVQVAYTLPTGGIMALPYGLDPVRLPRDEIIRDVSSRYHEHFGAPLFIAANVAIGQDYSYDAATYCMFSVIQTVGQLCGTDPNFIKEIDQDQGWRSFIEVMTMELTSTPDGLFRTRGSLEWVEVIGTIPFTYDPNKFSDPPERQLWDPEHESDRAFHLAWQGMVRWPSGEGLVVHEDNLEKRPYSSTRYKGTQYAMLRLGVPDPQTWEKWNPSQSNEADGKEY